MGRFFMQSPKRGDPISRRGLARGIAKMARALEGMNVENGNVEWSAFGVPTIVFGDDGQGDTIRNWRNGWPFGPQYAFGIKIIDAKVTIYPGTLEAFGAHTSAETTLTLTADGQYVGLQLKMVDKTLSVALFDARPATDDYYYRTALYSFDFDITNSAITGWHDHIHDIRMEAIF